MGRKGDLRVFAMILCRKCLLKRGMANFQYADDSCNKIDYYGYLKNDPRLGDMMQRG